MTELSIDDIIFYLGRHADVAESYVFVRELRLWVDYGGNMPFEIGVKTFKSEVVPGHSYHWHTSHLVHTPTQAAPYVTSNNWAISETEAIDEAIRKTLLHIQMALGSGHEFDLSWLIPNPSY